jgi:hypothetical protein
MLNIKSDMNVCHNSAQALSTCQLFFTSHRLVSNNEPVIRNVLTVITALLHVLRHVQIGTLSANKFRLCLQTIQKQIFGVSFFRLEIEIKIQCLQV